MNGERVIWVLIGMHNERLSTVGFLDGADVCVSVDLENREWVEGLDVLETRNSLEVQVPEIPEEASDKDLVVESFLENAR